MTKLMKCSYNIYNKNLQTQKWHTYNEYLTTHLLWLNGGCKWLHIGTLWPTFGNCWWQISFTLLNYCLSITSWNCHKNSGELFTNVSHYELWFPIQAWHTGQGKNCLSTSARSLNFTISNWGQPQLSDGRSADK